MLYLGKATACLTLLSAFSTAASSQIYLSPSINHHQAQEKAPIVDAHVANALLAHHLSLSRYERHASDYVKQLLPSNPFASHGQDALILLVQTDGDTAADYIPSSLSGQTSFQVDQASFESWESLVNLYIRRFTHALQIHISEIFGSDAFITMNTAFESAQDWIEHAWRNAFGNDIRVPRVPEPKQEYSRLLTELDIADHSSRLLVQDMTNLDTYIESLDSPSEKPRIAALNLQGLREVATAHGEDSTQFKAASAHFRQFLDAAIAAYQSKTHAQSKLVLITAPYTKPKLLQRRAVDPLAVFRQEAKSKRQLPSSQAKRLVTPIVPSSRLCYDSEDACTNATNSCSGHGSCIPGIKAGSPSNSCYVCACANVNGTQYAGNVCEKQDVSSSFFLVVSSAVLLFLAVGASIGLLVAGDDGLPQVLELSSKVE